MFLVVCITALWQQLIKCPFFNTQSGIDEKCQSRKSDKGESNSGQEAPGKTEDERALITKWEDD